MTTSWGVLVALTCGLMAGEENERYLIGRSLADITLPVVGVQMLGFVRPDQISEGLHQRQYARTFVIADAAGKNRVAMVTCDIAFPTHTLKLAVLDRLREKLGERMPPPAASTITSTPARWGPASMGSALMPWSRGSAHRSSPRMPI
jgi:hypothetical protein